MLIDLTQHVNLVSVNIFNTAGKAGKVLIDLTQHVNLISVNRSIIAGKPGKV